MFRDPSKLKMWELRYLVNALNQGTCYFVKVVGYGNWPAQTETAVAVKEKSERRDKGTCRGRQAHPARPRCHGKTGKVFHPYTSTANGELPEDPIENID